MDIKNLIFSINYTFRYMLVMVRMHVVVSREKVTRLLTAFADEFKEVSEISAGNIAVAVGLKQVHACLTIHPEVT